MTPEGQGTGPTLRRLLCAVFGHNWGRPLMWPIHADGECGGAMCIHMAQQCVRCGFHRMAP